MDEFGRAHSPCSEIRMIRNVSKCKNEICFIYIPKFGLCSLRDLNLIWFGIVPTIIKIKKNPNVVRIIVKRMRREWPQREKGSSLVRMCFFFGLMTLFIVIMMDFTCSLSNTSHIRKESSRFYWIPTSSLQNHTSRILLLTTLPL